MSTKTCNKCKTNQPIENFYKLTGKNYKPHWNCRSSCCKSCTSAKSTQTRRDAKAEAVEYKGSKCVDCGIQSTDYCIYDFHHLDPAQKDFSFGAQMKGFSEQLKEELDKCVLLCANCHRIRHYKK